MQNEAEHPDSAHKHELALVAKAQSGDSEAFTRLYDLYADRLYRFVYYRTGHKETAEDLTSVSFTKAYQNLHSFKGHQGVFGAWLFRIARNTVIDHMRTNKTTVDLEAAVNVASKTNISREAEVGDHVELVKKYLSQLDQVQRDVVTMRLWDDMPYSEIAEVVGKTEGNCKVIFSRVVQKMKQDLALVVSLILSLLIFQ
jgi:RNA polymerase sigma-70 factor (ECF subfamily)